jgi:hypothetical protein
MLRMEKANLIDLRIKGNEDLMEFAKGILVLTNLKSSVKETVLDIQTFEGSDLIAVTVYEDWYNDNRGKSYLESYVGEITHETKQVLFGIEYDDIKPEIMKEADEQCDKWLDDEDEQEREPFLYLMK